MGKKLLAIVTFALICLGSVVFAQNTNSSTMQMNGNMSNMNMSGRRHRRHRHKKHWRRGRRHMKMSNHNANM
jgi:hypothetical protein